jgi:hypothetical protein
MGGIVKNSKPAYFFTRHKPQTNRPIIRPQSKPRLEAARKIHAQLVAQLHVSLSE